MPCGNSLLAHHPHAAAAGKGKGGNGKGRPPERGAKRPPRDQQRPSDPRRLLAERQKIKASKQRDVELTLVKTATASTVCVGGHAIRITQCQAAGIPFHLWPSGMVLAGYIAEQPQLVRGKRVLELGSGCGIVGLVAAACEARHVMLTDLPEVCSHLRTNLAANQQSVRCEVGVLEWGNQEAAAALQLANGPFELVLVAECTYSAPLWPHLLRTLQELAAGRGLRPASGEEGHEPVKILLAHRWRNREMEQLIFDEMALVFHVHLLVHEEGHDSGGTGSWGDGSADAGVVDLVQLTLRQ